MLSYERALLGAGGLKEEPVYVEDVFSTWLYTGNGSTQTITNGIDLAGEGGMVWTKPRSTTLMSELVDTARGPSKPLITYLTNPEGPTSDITAFTSSGFNLGYVTGNSNEPGVSFASWTFRKAPGFFDVVTYTGNGVTGRQIPHDLGSVPGCMIVKRLDGVEDWIVYHRTPGATQFARLNTTGSFSVWASPWDFTEPTSTHFTVGNNIVTNASGNTYVAYLFAHDEQIFGKGGNESVIKCGSYAGSGTSQAINLGWEPQWILVKNVTNASAWRIYDSMRGWGVQDTGDSKSIQPNTSDAESPAHRIHLNATGFEFQNEAANDVNASGQTYVYIAIRRGPMKTPEDATKVFFTGAASSSAAYGVGFPTDLFVLGDRIAAVGLGQPFLDRLRGSIYLSSARTTAETVSAGNQFDLQNSFKQNLTSQSTSRYNFRRAPGFFDVVAYTGTGVARTVAHNLGVAPELMIVKRRNLTESWAVYSAALPATDRLRLNFDGGAAALTTYWNSTAPTSSVFTVGTDNATNANTSTYIAYLFATTPGVSKVGSYTGTGTTLNVDCGFTAGARFVLIKRTDSTGDWYIWDTARGIVSGNDSYLLLNSTAAEVTNTDYIDPLSSGFQITSTAPAAINASGGNFIFLAVA